VKPDVLPQKDVAKQLGANFKTYEKWEQEKYEPEFRNRPESGAPCHFRSASG
jgi:hypothetical protein